MVRVKFRYFLSEIVTEKHNKTIRLPVKEKDIKQTVLNIVQETHGDFGLACIHAGFSIKMYNPVTRLLIFRVRRQYHEILGSALSLITAVGKLKLILRTLHLTGTIRSAYKFIINYDYEKLNEVIHKLQMDEEQKEELKQVIENCHKRLAKRRLDVK